MTLRTVSYRLRSSQPLIHHNGQLADPLNQWSRLLKQISSKKPKTDADMEEMARLEFFGSLYMSKDGPVIPSDCLSAMIVGAAKKFREGDKAKTGIICDQHALLEYDGPRDVDGLWKAGTFRDTRGVRISNKRIMRTRPIFHDWSTVVTFMVDDEVVNPSRLDDWLQTGGKLIGLLDYRPRYGRFSAERV
jgi:hypothetical protein